MYFIHPGLVLLLHADNLPGHLLPALACALSLSPPSFSSPGRGLPHSSTPVPNGQPAYSGLLFCIMLEASRPSLQILHPYHRLGTISMCTTQTGSLCRLLNTQPSFKFICAHRGLARSRSWRFIQSLHPRMDCFFHRVPDTSW